MQCAVECLDAGQMIGCRPCFVPEVLCLSSFNCFSLMNCLFVQPERLDRALVNSTGGFIHVARREEELKSRNYHFSISAADFPLPIASPISDIKHL